MGATRYIDSPKTPAISVYTLENGEYRLQQFRGRDRIFSPTFPQLTLTAKAIFQASGLAD
ncbi:Uma2 family endonuclease [Oscillatoria sp. CS-180]|nr:Uma2 family endonuclease [Oscillatoria sp. CS-180]MDB9525845.1 Uma2 family endonuclease [Oscillatoria sp. CS-180]